MYYPTLRNSTTAPRVLVRTMGHLPRTASPSCWYNLQQTLGGSFTARARGFLATEFVLFNLKSEEFGQLHLSEDSSVEFTCGSSVITVEVSERRYRMVASGEEVLIAGPKERSTDELEISCGGQNYEARVGFLRNLTIANHAPGGERTVRLSGNLIGRSYQALFAAEDRCALPVAVFLLWYVAANRRRAYRARSLVKGGLV